MEDGPDTEGNPRLVDLTHTLVAAPLVLAGNIHPEAIVHHLAPQVGTLDAVSPVVVVLADQPVLPVIMSVLGENLPISLLLSGTIEEQVLSTNPVVEILISSDLFVHGSSIHCEIVLDGINTKLDCLIFFSHGG